MRKIIRTAIALACGGGLAFLAWSVFSSEKAHDPANSNGIEGWRDGNDGQSGDGAATSSGGDGKQGTRGEREGDGERKRDERGARAAPLVRVTLRCVDAETGARLAGVRCYDQQARRELGISDDAGELRIAGATPRFLIVWGDGFLSTPLSEEARRDLLEGRTGEQKIWRDRYTMRRPLRLLAKAGAAVPTRGALHIRNLDVAKYESEAFPSARIGAGRAIERELSLAWQTHVRHQISLPRHSVFLRAGARHLPWRGKLQGLVLRFAEERRYELRAYAEDGRVARTVVSVRARDKEPIELRFEQGDSVTVRVRGPSKSGLAGALVKLRFPQRRSEAERNAQTDAKGIAVFRGLVEGDALRISVSARGHTAKSVEGRVGAPIAAIDLRAVAMHAHRIRIREIRSNRTVAGAKLYLGDPSVQEVLVKSNAEGIADLQLQQSEQAVLTVRADGFGEHREILPVKAGLALPSVVYLVPEDRARQLQLGLVAKIEGRVLRGGKPIMGARVRLMPTRNRDGRLASDAMKDSLMTPIRNVARSRLILAGQRVRAMLDASTDENGRFVLWPSARGRATLQDYSKDGGKRDLFIVLGKTQSVDLQ